LTAYCRRKVCALPEEAKAETVHPGFSRKFNAMIHIDNKEWFDSNGNTYFSAEVYLNSDLIMSMPMQYGYNESCRQVFEMAFCKHFNIDYQNAPGWVVRETLGKNGIKISVSTRDVKKRDLNKGEAFQDFTPFLKPENLALYAHYRILNNIGTGNVLLQSVGKKTFGNTPIGFTVLGKEVDLSSINWF
jgi:hypothetical protein